MNQIETTRRAMYECLANAKSRIEIKYSVNDMLEGVDEFEGVMEEHLEALRKEMDGLKGDVRTAESAHDQGRELVRVLKTQVATLLGEIDEARADRSKYRQWMRSAVRQNRAERQNVKAYRETQDELVAQIARLQRELAGRMAQRAFVVGVSERKEGNECIWTISNAIAHQNAPQDPKQ